MKIPGKLTLLITAGIFAALPVLSQTSAPPKLSFDVISIKPNPPNVRCTAVGSGFRGNRYTVVCSTLRMLVQRAYQRLSTTPIAPIQIVSAPTWIDSDRYDIQATANCSVRTYSAEQIQLMFRSMLEDRFQLKAHKEIREGLVYSLVVAKYPPKIKLSEDQTPIPRQAAAPPEPCSSVPEAPTNAAPPRPRFGPGSPFDPDIPAPRGFVGISFALTGVTVRGAAVPISSMMGTLQRYFSSPITDKTNLTGLYDFALRFSQEGLVNTDGMPIAPADRVLPPGLIDPADRAPTLFIALQEVGLKLEPDKGPVEVVVVDSVQRPSEN